jgi:ribosome-associated heat shock protein Hsp15
LSAAHQHEPDPGREEACRLDVWLWRARFFKSRGLAARFLEEGRVRLTRPGSDAVRVDKPSRMVRPGDAVLFAIGGRLVAVQVESLGDRRGPSSEARALYCESPH